MRPRYRIPRNKKYFHTKPKMSKKDTAIIKRKIANINQKTQIMEEKKQLLKNPFP